MGLRRTVGHWTGPASQMGNSHEVRLSSSVQNLPFGLKRIFPRNEISFLHFRFLGKKTLSNSKQAGNYPAFRLFSSASNSMQRLKQGEQHVRCWLTDARLSFVCVSRDSHASRTPRSFRKYPAR
jgi:hypothetical protein